jgi:CubicO group peptidase (beta-lactamase class C family)
MVAQLLVAQSKKDRLDNIMKTYHGYNMFDGSVLVAEKGKVIYKNAFGLANREWNIPNTTDTKFMIGSISKPLTALLTLIQVQKAIIKLDNTVSDYLPDFAKKNGSRITINQLLSHTSGLPNYDIIKDFFPKISRQHFSREEYIKIFMDSALVFEPGTNYYYSSWGYFTLGYILEKVTGKTYAQLMKDDIFDKIGMNNSGSYFHTRIISKRATGYDYALDNFTSSDFRDQSNTMGTGDIYSTVEDLFKLHMALANHTLLNKELTDKMFTPGFPPAKYGYGWFNRIFKYTETDSVFTNYHLGMTDGFISFMLRIPSTNSMIVILCNSSPTDFLGITGNLMKVLFNKPVKIKEPVHKAMETIIANKGAIRAVEEYHRMKKDTAKFYIDWLSMDYLGNQLFALKKYDEARIIFENNVIEFPDKSLVLISLAKTYQELGRIEDAIIWYKKTLAINPAFEEAKNRIKELEQKLNDK